MNFKGKKGFLKGYFGRKKVLNAKKKGFPQLILHLNSFEITVLQGT